MSKLTQRLLTFFIGIPLVMCVVYVDVLNHIVLAAAISVFTFWAAGELYSIFSKTQKLLPKPLVISLSVLLPVAAYFIVFFGLPTHYITWVLIFGILVLMAYASVSLKKFDNANETIALSVFALCYSGYPLTFLIRMTAFENEVYFLACFLCMVFLCDSCAWLFGMTLGKGNRGIVAASPNKSVAGFIGGFAGSIALGILVAILFPDVFGGIGKTVILGIVTAFSAETGDLVESVFKRSANCKDSGNAMPGRGGILDSIDSIIFSAPIFYCAMHFVYKLPIY